MVEKIVQKEDGGRTEGENRLFKLPKHIKQMGLGGNSPEIYIEDYAEGYLRRLAGSDYTECRVAVLVGEFIKSEGKRYVFIRGAIEAEDVMVENSVQFTSGVWANIYEKIKRYFPQYEAVGWFLGGPEFLTEVTDEIRQIHVDWFGGRDRVLYRIDPVEKDAVFYLYDKGELKQWPGYCIYYEKNEEMQDYLVAGELPSVDAGYQEPILAEISKRVGRKTEKEEVPAEFAIVKEDKALSEKKEERAVGKTGGGHGKGIVAAVALLTLGAFALRERELRQTGIADVPTQLPTPPTVEYVQRDDMGEVLQANAGVPPTEKAADFTGPEGSIFEREFVPVTEEPYEQEERYEETSVTAEPEKEIPTSTTVPEEEDVTATDAMTLYIVQSGDTLAGICKEFYGTTVRMEEVKGLNQIPDENWIYAGQELYLP